MTQSMQRLSALMATIAMMACGANVASASTAEDLDKDSRQALATLSESSAIAKEIASSAKAVLVFPNIVKAGLVFGGSYGEGQLIENDKVVDYYNSVTASWGLQAGAQSYGYAIYLMNDEAVNYLKNSKGWEIGIGPTVVIVDDGIAKNLSTSSLREDAYAFIFSQQGLMLGISIEGTKVSRIDR